MGPRKRGQPDRSELEDLVAKHARIEEFGEEHPESCKREVCGTSSWALGALGLILHRPPRCGKCSVDE